MSKSMVYICEHSDKGAMGVVINKILPNINSVRKKKSEKKNRMPHISLNLNLCSAIIVALTFFAVFIFIS